MKLSQLRRKIKRYKNFTELVMPIRKTPETKTQAYKKPTKKIHRRHVPVHIPQTVAHKQSNKNIT